MLTADHMERLIRRYYEGCNQADVDKMAGCFTAEAVHYFPPGMPGGPFRGAQAIAQAWAQMVRKTGASWTIDALLLDPAAARAVIEWSNFVPRRNLMVRGSEWVEFDRTSGLIREIRAYLAAPLPRDLADAELEGFEYAARGYRLREQSN